jgi:hypothetical protein
MAYIGAVDFGKAKESLQRALALRSDFPEAGNARQALSRIMGG